MPLKKGSSQKTISHNTDEMMISPTFASDKDPKKRLAMALAASYAKAGKSRKK